MRSIILILLMGCEFDIHWIKKWSILNYGTHGTHGTHTTLKTDGTHGTPLLKHELLNIILMTRQTCHSNEKVLNFNLLQFLSRLSSYIKNFIK